MGGSINPYQVNGEGYTGKQKEFITELIQQMHGQDWYDESDQMSDYFDTQYYIEINIGKYNKEYIVK